jgi:hypothetical protein
MTVSSATLKTSASTRRNKGMLLYPATVRPDGNSFTLIFPDAHTNGNTREHALSHASDALHIAISLLMEKNLDIPEPVSRVEAQCWWGSAR